MNSFRFMYKLCVIGGDDGSKSYIGIIEINPMPSASMVYNIYNIYNKNNNNIYTYR